MSELGSTTASGTSVPDAGASLAERSASEHDHFVDWCDANDRDFEDPEALSDWHDELVLRQIDAAAERWEREELFG